MGSDGASSGIDPYAGRGGVSTTYGSEFQTLIVDGNVKFITVRNPNESVRTPKETRCPGRVYVTITEKGKVQSVTTYDQKGKKATQIDILHPHGGLIPHVHDYDDHSTARPLTQTEEYLLKYAIKKWSEHEK